MMCEVMCAIVSCLCVSHLLLLCYIAADYIMLELLKNSMRATVEWHGIDGDFPPIKIVIADGSDNEDVVIKVSDEGELCGIVELWDSCFQKRRQKQADVWCS